MIRNHRGLRAFAVITLTLASSCAGETAPPGPQQVFDAPQAPVAEEAPAPVEPAPASASAEDIALASEPMGGDVTSPFSVVPDMDKSTLSFVSTKNGGTEVAGSFAVVLGGFNFDETKLSASTGVLNVELDSVDTGLPLRDTNLAETFFGRVVGKVIRSDVEFLAFRPETEALAVGEKTLAEVDLRINLRGNGNLASSKVELTRTSATGWTMKTTEPVVLSIADLGMQGRSDSLKERCGHQSIGDKVTISAEIVLAPPQ